MRKLILALILLPALARAQEKPAEAEAPAKRIEAETSRSYLRFAFNFYKQKDGEGNPNLKEDMTVLEPQILLGLGLGEKLSLNLKLQADIITAASVDKKYRFLPGTQSGASGDKFFGAEGGLFYAWSDQVKTGIGVSTSTEYDYKSRGINARFIYDTPDKNDTFLIKASAFFDTLDIIKFDGSEDGTESRNSYSLGLGWTHVLGRRTQMTLNYDLTIQRGFLATPYNSVFIRGKEYEEVLPSSRMRHNLFGRVRHLLLDDLAVEPGIGVYADDWGALAFNLEVRAFWEAIPGVLIVQPWYRFHGQTEVDQFVDTSASSLPKHRTQDSDLDAFDSHTFGLKLVTPHVKIFGIDTEFELGADYSIRSDFLDSYSVTFGVMVRF
ncbi:MAG: DUF3570 domain-containing protein [Planctomycetota bacterium]